MRMCCNHIMYVLRYLWYFDVVQEDAIKQITDETNALFREVVGVLSYLMIYSILVWVLFAFLSQTKST